MLQKNCYKDVSPKLNLAMLLAQLKFTDYKRSFAKQTINPKGSIRMTESDIANKWVLHKFNVDFIVTASIKRRRSV